MTDNKGALLRNSRSFVVWLPASILGVHATLVGHVTTVLGHWPRQYLGPELRETASAALRFHEVVANLGVLCLPIAIVALILIGVFHGVRGSSQLTVREISVFATPFAVWILGVLLSRELSMFYGWLWD